jgi:hypothetical protein
MPSIRSFTYGSGIDAVWQNEFYGGAQTDKPFIRLFQGRTGNCRPAATRRDSCPVTEGYKK